MHVEQNQRGGADGGRRFIVTLPDSWLCVANLGTMGLQSDVSKMTHAILIDISCAGHIQRW
jgi:hypothetical protein